MVAVNVPLIVAGALATLAAAIHGGAGQALVVRKLSSAPLPPTRFGGSQSTLLMIQVTWHLTTVAFITAATALLLAGSVLEGDAAHAVALLGAGAATGFAAVTLGLGVASNRSLHALIRHPAPIVLTATALLAWWGAV